MKVKIVLIALSLLLQSPFVFARASSLGLSASLAIYFVLFLASWFSLAAAAMLQSSLLRWALALAFASGSFFSTSFFSAMGQELTYDAFVNLWDARGFAEDAASQFASDLLRGALEASLLLVGIGLAPKADERRSNYLGVVPGFFLIAVSVLFFFRGGEGGRGLPGALVAPAYAMVFAYDGVLNDSGPREPVRIRHVKMRAVNDIVLIVDESIAGQYLDINNPDGVYSGLAQERQNFTIHNFGIAASITHCSTGTNLTLRYGGTRENYRQINATGPSIWAYAKAAGLQTIYVDAQRIGGAYQNGMNDTERNEIDKWVQFDNVSVINRDQAVADRLAQYLNDEKSQFILVNKMGAHFPVQAKYPENRTRFKPVASRQKFVNIVEPTERDTGSVSREEWRLYRNAYRNVIEWNVGAFFDRLFSAVDRSGAVLLYTSDHGQNMHESGEPGNATHCTPEPSIEEGVVPMVVIDGSKTSEVDWRSAALQNRNATSHYRIFPTILALMGYEPQAVRKAYGEGIDAPTPDKLLFNARFNARLGREPTWKLIDPAQIKALRQNDYVRGGGVTVSRNEAN